LEKLSVDAVIGGWVMLIYITHSPDETVELGKQLGTLLQPGMVLLLEGGLGAGKTCLAGGILRSLGVDEHVTSPTYTLVNEYEGKFPTAHFDLYRLDEPGELFDIGFEEYFDGQRVVLIEWPERAGGYLPQEYLRVVIQGIGNERKILIEGVGADYAELGEEMRNLAGTRN
jgi:tRNA threonylcarbamoyladenosine biosynthesis protein TsaE